jgi:signal transduction histidine kinase
VPARQAAAARAAAARDAALRRARHEADALRRTVELQEHLLGIVGHDLRTPLSAVVLASGLLERGGRLGADQARANARIRSSAARMKGIIRDLLEFSRLRRAGGFALDRQPARLDQVCAQAARELAYAYPHRVIQLSAAAVEGVWDAIRVEQIVSNLLSNALQHGGEGDPVVVRTWAEGDHGLVEVENAGEPIPPELLPAVFEPFRTGDAHKRGSVGLGLFIVRELAAAHGGTVEVASDAAGTRFTVRLPLAGDPAVALR